MNLRVGGVLDNLKAEKLEKDRPSVEEGEAETTLLTKDTEKSSGISAHSAKRIKSLSSAHS